MLEGRGAGGDLGALGLVSAADGGPAYLKLEKAAGSLIPIRAPLPFPREGPGQGPPALLVNRQQVCSSGSVACSDLSLHHGEDGGEH